MRNLYFFILGLLFLPITSFSQFYYSCNSFDTTITNVSLETQGIWELGLPTKPIFNSSYSGMNSIVTDLDSLYPVNDTSRFYLTYSNTDQTPIIDYLGLYGPFSMSFHHRFVTDSVSDYGTIDISIDQGVTWFDILSGSYNFYYPNQDPNSNAHFYEESEITVFDSLSVSGDSQGWIYSTFYKDLNTMFYESAYENPNWDFEDVIDSVIVRFSFFSDSLGGNEGWQIDDICLSIDIFDNVTENHKDEDVFIYPNPNRGSFRIRESYGTDAVRIYNLFGKEVYSEMISKEEILTNLPQGMYLVVIQKADGVHTERMIVE